MATAKKSVSNRSAASTRAANRLSHDANPDVPTDSSVRHAEPADGKPIGDGEGGYPAGEYDVVDPNVTRTKAGDDPLPVGTLIEHEALNRWRVHVNGQNRFGHGDTMQKAIKDFLNPEGPKPITTDPDAAQGRNAEALRRGAPLPERGIPRTPGKVSK